MNAYMRLDVDQINYMQESIGTRGLVTVGCSILKLAYNANLKSTSSIARTPACIPREEYKPRSSCTSNTSL
jgi:hypothetical protein